MPHARRVGHATFETPYMGKSLDHWLQVAGLVLAGREDRRESLAAFERRDGKAEDGAGFHDISQRQLLLL